MTADQVAVVVFLGLPCIVCLYAIAAYKLAMRRLDREAEAEARWRTYAEHRAAANAHPHTGDVIVTPRRPPQPTRRRQHP